jgi:hypothetical protein
VLKCPGGVAHSYRIRPRNRRPGFGSRQGIRFFRKSLLLCTYILCIIRVLKKWIEGSGQCDQMSLWKIRPKYSPTHFLSSPTWCLNLTVEWSSQKMLFASVIFMSLLKANNSPLCKKFAQSGHPAQSLMKINSTTSLSLRDYISVLLTNLKKSVFVAYDAIFCWTTQNFVARRKILSYGKRLWQDRPSGNAKIATVFFYLPGMLLRKNHVNRPSLFVRYAASFLKMSESLSLVFL